MERRSCRRPPETVAYTSPRDATGTFELQPQTDTGMRNPFEGVGVDTRMTLRMPKGSNIQIDYESIADVLVTYEYTALSSEEYRRQVLADLDDEVNAQRTFSFQQELSDQWYDLHNPDQTSEPMTVRFQTSPDDFPANVDDPRIEDVLMYFPGSNGGLPTDSQVELGFGGERSLTVTMSATPQNGIVSTRRKRWEASMSGMTPFGEWTLKLPNIPQVRKQFTEDKIDDILFVITYRGETDYGTE